MEKGFSTVDKIRGLQFVEFVLICVFGFALIYCILVASEAASARMRKAQQEKHNTQVLQAIKKK